MYFSHHPRGILRQPAKYNNTIIAPEDKKDFLGGKAWPHKFPSLFSCRPCCGPEEDVNVTRRTTPTPDAALHQSEKTSITAALMASVVGNCCRRNPEKLPPWMISKCYALTATNKYPRQTEKSDRGFYTGCSFLLTFYGIKPIIEELSPKYCRSCRPCLGNQPSDSPTAAHCQESGGQPALPGLHPFLSTSISS